MVWWLIGLPAEQCIEALGPAHRWSAPGVRSGSSADSRPTPLEATPPIFPATPQQPI
ncbi:MAG: hypothetical protein MZV70_02365 [Desulfobacterales bacterium]|nr:hypothetical protein [Desulfobacterales bacterium]